MSDDNAPLWLKNLDSELRESISRVIDLSDFFAAVMESPIGEALAQSGDFEQSYDNWRFPELENDLSVQDLAVLLRDVRNREMARIIYRDLTRLADLVETTRDLSRLADECIEVALEYHYNANCQRFGVPLNSAGEAQRVCVLGLGKLGAQELNLSSDIDLIFFYEESGTVEGESGLTNQEFFLRTSLQLIRSLDDKLPNGFVFRVDMRLRPYGESGALILSRTAMENYFVEQGRDWERYAFIKARPVAGDVSLGEDFLKWLKPFVYRRHLDYGAIESLRAMKGLINQEVKRKELADDIKLGPGGIREVEFIVQAQQLIWGGNVPVLQQRRLIETLGILSGEGILPIADIEVLLEGYVFLRNTEHAIQAEKDRQTQLLPVDKTSRRRLAEAMGFSSYETFIVQLDTHRNRISDCFERLMDANNSEQEILVEGNLFWVSIWQKPESEESGRLLLKHGFENVDTVVTALSRFADSLDELQDIALDRMHKLMPVLLSLVAREQDADQTFARVLPIVDGIKRRSTYIAFLNENVDALQRLIRLCAMSPWVASRINEFPILLYELTDRNIEDRVLDKAALTEELDEQLELLPPDDLEAQMDCLRTFKHASVLKVAMFELLDMLPTMKASDSLTYIAEVVLQAAVRIASDLTEARHGQPCDAGGQREGIHFGVIAYGKLGGLELGYGSDLDLVFLHNSDVSGETDGEKTIANSVFYNRLGQRVVHILTSFTRFGVVYELDLRLRPDGNKGALVGSLKAFERYQRESAWIWEHQALVRARFVAGSQDCETQFEDIRRAILGLPRDPVKLREEVISMREKMRAHLEKQTHSETADDVLMSGFDLKHGSGAIVDIEFLVQYLVLEHGHAHRDLSEWSDKVRLLDNLEIVGLLNDEERETLQAAYVAYRSAVHYTWLGGEMSSYERLNEYREQVVQIWQRHLRPGEPPPG